MTGAVRPGMGRVTRLARRWWWGVVVGVLVGQRGPDAEAFESGAVSAGFYHSCGVRSDGTVACWGDNSSGQASPPGGR